MVPWRVSTTKFEWLPDDFAAFVPSMLWKLLCITRWDDSQSQNRPIDSAEDALLILETSRPNCGAANPGCGVPSGAAFSRPLPREGSLTSRKSRPKRRLQARLPAPQQMQNIADEKSMRHHAGVPAPRLLVQLPADFLA